jgi:hypothetical protein
VNSQVQIGFFDVVGSNDAADKLRNSFTIDIGNDNLSFIAGLHDAFSG